MGCPDVVKRLVEHFDHQLDQVRSPEYNEAQLRIDFINPMFAELGWDIENAHRYAEQYREVVSEDRIRIGGESKAPDYSFRIGGTRKFFLEAKKPFVNIKENVEAAYQLRRYAWSAKLPASILTDFEELAIYDTRIRPKHLEKASTARRDYITYKQYEEKWDFLAGTFSKDAVLRGDFDRYCGTTRGRGAQEFDDAFLEEIEDWRKKLASNLALRNESLDEQAVNFAVQRIIDRIIFLRICEDRGIELVGRLRALMNSDHVYGRLFDLFRAADDRYNSGLFHFKKESGRDEEPDELTPGLEIDDALLKSIIKRLYYPDSPYEFSVVSADILGSVYERFLGKVITVTPSHRVKIEPKPEVRKAGGVYYTPTYIVQYIVQQTVGKLLEGKTPKQAEKLRVLDPACGSGSFLIGAYQHVLDWHLKWYTDNDPQSHARGRKAALRPGKTGDWRLTINERKRILLNNIFGVDIDYQAVEVTKLSLLLKVLEGETVETLGGLWAVSHERALPDLGNNIKCGNSLVGTDIMATEAWQEMSEDERRRVNPFDFEQAFPHVFRPGGFDVVIGNPPYVRMEEFKAIKAYLSETYETHEERADLYAYFVERGNTVLRPDGRFGMIVSNKFIRAKYGRPLREFLAARSDVEAVLDFAGLPVFQQATVRTVVLITRRSAERVQRTSAIYLAPVAEELFRIIRSGGRSVDEVVADRAVRLPLRSLDASNWQLSTGAEQDLLDKLSLRGVRLASVLDNRVLWGVKTGCNEAFVVSDEIAASLRRSDPASSEILKPLVVGEDIRRYYIRRPSAYLLYMYHGIDPAAYTAAIRHLRRFRQKLEARATRQNWYELQQPSIAMVPALEGPKIVYPEIAPECRFAIDESGAYCNNKTFVLPTADRYLLGLLNSRVARFFFEKRCAALEGKGGRYLEFRAQYVREFPVIQAAVDHRQEVSARVESLGELRRKEEAAKLPQEKEHLRRQIEATDRQIDQLVYELYGLSEAEIRVVEGSESLPATDVPASQFEGSP